MVSVSQWHVADALWWYHLALTCIHLFRRKQLTCKVISQLCQCTYTALLWVAHFPTRTCPTAWLFQSQEMLAKSSLSAKPLIHARSPWAGTTFLLLRTGTGTLWSCVCTSRLAQYMGSIWSLCPIWNCPLLVFLLSGGLLQLFKYL